MRRAEIHRHSKESLASLFEQKVRLGKTLELFYDGIKCKSPEEIRSIVKYARIRSPSE